MTVTTAIATKLNVLESAIIHVEEWASVLFVVVKGLGVRFVSKKVMVKKVERNMAVDYKTEAFSVLETIVRCYRTGAWVRVNNSTGAVSAEFANLPHKVSDEHRKYAIAQSAVVKAKKKDNAHVLRANDGHRRSSCLNCGITSTMLLGRGYCTDCHGEC